MRICFQVLLSSFAFKCNMRRYSKVSLMNLAQVLKNGFNFWNRRHEIPDIRLVQDLFAVHPEGYTGNDDVRYKATNAWETSPRPGLFPFLVFW